MGRADLVDCGSGLHMITRRGFFRMLVCVALLSVPRKHACIGEGIVRVVVHFRPLALGGSLTIVNFSPS